MDEETAARLLALNRTFYDQLADPFAESRQRPQPGFEQLLAYLPARCQSVLDVGCGEGRFGRFLAGAGFEGRYRGVDFSEKLLRAAAARLPARLDSAFQARDLAAGDALAGLGDYSLVACLAVLQHIPGRARRVSLLREMGRRLKPGGRVFLSTWQFLGSPRQRRKVVPWQEAGIDPASVEPGDHLLTWRGGGAGLRYVAYIDEAETSRLAAEAGLDVLAQFRSDGREGDLNLYTVLARE
jgi:2-polyprenyl-3-methyl-5-hydroxy-6-metoxy-1,4-benzoquinol methylase